MTRVCKFISLISAAILFGSQAYAQSGEAIVGLASCCKEGTVSTIDTAINTIRSEAASAGVKLLYENAEEAENSDMGLQLQQVKHMVDQGAKAIIVIVVQGAGKDTDSAQRALVDYCKSKNIPLIAVRRPVSNKLLKRYNRLYSVVHSAKEAGVFQGRMTHDLWKNHPEWDKNKDKVMQVAILKGKEGQPKTEQRTSWAIKTIEKYPGASVDVEQVAIATADWNREKAKEITKQWIADGIFDKTEVLIANADDMALGAIDAFKEAGKEPLPIVGINAIKEGLAAIESGELQGSVMQSSKDQAETAFKIAYNLARGKKAGDGLEDVQFVGGNSVSPPSQIVTKENVSKYLKK
ncbi:MAG: substrate-binding domain-containing protein [Cardiobacteriaceae bacterium]|nr:substrate-binding domain-containing protein [Cardiobacteriaceae bacterium]